MFKSTTAEYSVHIERQPASTGTTDDSTAAGGVQLYSASPAGFQGVTMPFQGAAPAVESWASSGASSTGGSTLGANTQLLFMQGRNHGWMPPSRRLFVYDTTGGVITDTATFNLTDPYGTSITAYADAVMCNKVVNPSGPTNFRLAVKNTV
jgi:hypothetical protein